MEESSNASQGRYVVLEAVYEENRSEPTFRVVGGVSDGEPKTWPAPGQRQAIRAATEAPGTYVAVPARSFTAHRLTEVEPTLAVSGGEF